MNKEELQMKIADIENKIDSIEAETAHLDLLAENAKLEAEKAKYQSEKEKLVKGLVLLKQNLADVKAEFDETKRFKRQLCLNNVDYLLAKQNKKLGELESNSGNRPGYLSRMKSGKSSSDPSIEFLMTAAEEFNVPIELLIAADLTQMTATEEFIIEFMNKLIEDTQSDGLVWTRETMSDLENMESYNGCVNHPLYVVEEHNDDLGYHETIVYKSCFFPNSNAKPCGDCYNAYLPGTNNHIYIMKCAKGDDRIQGGREVYYEIYMVDVDKYGHGLTKKIGNTLEMNSAIVVIVESLVKNIITSLNRVHIESDVRNVIDAYLKGLDITANDDEMPFK